MAADHECSGRTCNFCKATQTRRPLPGSQSPMAPGLPLINAARHNSNQYTLQNLQESLASSNLEETEQLALVDKATGLYNSRTLLRELAREVAMSARRKCYVSVCMISITVPRQMQQQFGMSVNDLVLRSAADVIKNSCVRETDIAGRSGGHELAVILPDCDMDGATLFAERVRLALHNEIRAKQGYWLATMHLAVGCFPGIEKRNDDLMTQVRNAIANANLQNDEIVQVR